MINEHNSGTGNRLSGMDMPMGMDDDSVEMAD